MSLYVDYLRWRKAKLKGLDVRNPRQEKKLAKVNESLYHATIGKQLRNDGAWDVTLEQFSNDDVREAMAEQNQQYEDEMGVYPVLVEKDNRNEVYFAPPTTKRFADGKERKLYPGHVIGHINGETLEKREFNSLSEYYTIVEEIDRVRFECNR